MMFSYIFNGSQMTLLFILRTAYDRKTYSSMETNLQQNELYNFGTEVLPYSKIEFI